MTADQIRTEIETGPLAAELATFWGDVFPTEPEPPADDPARPRWERISGRFGQLKPDAAYDLCRVLTDPTRRTRATPGVSRGSFLAALAPLAIALAGKDAATQQKWLPVLNLATGGDDEVNIARPDLQAMFDLAVADGLMSADLRAYLATGPALPCSRADELGWVGLTPDLIAVAKEGDA